jgi:TonB family protein
LIEVAGHDLLPHLSKAGTAMVRARELHARIHMIFQEVDMSRRRRVVVSIAILTVVTAAGWSAAIYAPLQAMSATGVVSRGPARVKEPLGAPSPVAMPTVVTLSPVTARAAQASPSYEEPRRQLKASYPEYPADAIEKGISGTVTVNLAINPAGDVSTAGVVDGPQELRASAFKAAIGLKYTPAASTTAMTIYVEYRLDHQSWGVRIAEHPSPVMAFATAPRPPPTNVQEPSGAYRVGGDIRAPRKIRDAPPVYPADALNASVQGVVILEITIDATGSVSDEKALRSIPLLDQAALEAVKQWQYEPTLLNGQPVPVVLTVTVNFTKRNTPHEVIGLTITTPDGRLLSRALL